MLLAAAGPDASRRWPPGSPADSSTSISPAPISFCPPAAGLGLTALQVIHTECDVHGTRLLQRYADYRRLARIAGQIGMRKRDDTTAEAAPVEPRQVGGWALH